MLKLSPDFDSRTYGHTRLSDLVENTDGFEIERRNGPVFARVKPAKPKKTKAG